MGLFIHTPIQTINQHRKLLELEKQSEIASGLMYLQKMIEDDPNFKPSDDSLKAFERLLKFLPEHQRNNGIDQLFVKLFQNSRSDEPDEIVESQVEDQEPQSIEEMISQISDFELDYQITLKRGKKGDQEIQQTRIKGQQLQNQPIKEVVDPKTVFYQKVEAEWQRIQPIIEENNRRSYLALKAFMARYKNQEEFNNHRLQEANQKLNALDPKKIKAKPAEIKKK